MDMRFFVRFVNKVQMVKRALSVVLLLPLCVCTFAQETWQKAFSSPWRIVMVGKLQDLVARS